MVINCGALGCLLTLLTANHKKSIKKEACWTISNITAGTKEQIQAVIDANILPPLVHLLQVRGCACVPALQHWTSLGGVLGRRCMAQESLGWQGQRASVAVGVQSSNSGGSCVSRSFCEVSRQ